MECLPCTTIRSEFYRVYNATTTTTNTTFCYYNNYYYYYNYYNYDYCYHYACTTFPAASLVYFTTPSHTSTDSADIALGCVPAVAWNVSFSNDLSIVAVLVSFEVFGARN